MNNSLKCIRCQGISGNSTSADCTTYIIQTIKIEKQQLVNKYQVKVWARCDNLHDTQRYPQRVTIPYNLQIQWKRCWTLALSKYLNKRWEMITKKARSPGRGGDIGLSKSLMKLLDGFTLLSQIRCRVRRILLDCHTPSSIIASGSASKALGSHPSTVGLMYFYFAVFFASSATFPLLRHFQALGDETALIEHIPKSALNF